ncbi:MAG: AgmX/PglI C-terminal domain-containing protein, partial [Gemmatimonadaceae bacterium]
SDVGELGSFVRSRESQLRFCYQEYGLKANPNLAGSITVNISLGGSGNVTDVDIGRRTWSGAGASEAEGCIRQRVRGWKFPTSSTGEGTYGFSFNFTPGG